MDLLDGHEAATSQCHIIAVSLVEHVRLEQNQLSCYTGVRYKSIYKAMCVYHTTHSTTVDVNLYL